MCVNKLTQKQLDDICKEAIELEKTQTEEILKSYSVAKAVQHYEDINGYQGNS